MDRKDSQLASFVSLNSISGIGRKTIRYIKNQLIKNQITWSEFWVLSHDKLIKIGISDNTALAIKNFNKEQTMYSCYEALLEQDIWVVSESDKDYPSLLAHTEDKPLLLYGRGNKSILQKQMIAIVGTRRITSYGTFVAESFAREFAQFGLPVISGCMYGVDAVTQRAVLENKGLTVGVLGYGLNVIPYSAKKLTTQIIDSGGAVVSEYAPDCEATKGTFPERNRIIAGIAMGVIVVEAAQKSGSHITALCALNEGRSVFAVPGPITNPYSQGTAWLLQQGATPITSGLEAIRLLSENYSLHKTIESQKTITKEVIFDHQQLSTDQMQLLRVIQSGVSTQEQLQSAQSWPISQLLRELSNLEVFGILERRGSDWFVRST
ncbi:MAG: DNA-processing protein DprA [Microgenomates group bacterium]